jgi:hypothetical protein
MNVASPNIEHETTRRAPRMHRYMPDNVFDSCVVLGLSTFFSRKGYGYLDREVCGAFSTYFRNYDNDEFVRQGVVAAERIMGRLRSLAGSEQGISAYLDQIASCIRIQWPNGTKRKWRFLRWARRGYEIRPNLQRAEMFLEDFEGYSSNLKDRRISL